MYNLEILINEIKGKHILKNEEEFENKILKKFKGDEGTFLYFDEIESRVFALNIDEMKEKKSKFGYMAYEESDDTLNYFIVSSCVQVLKEFTDMSYEEIKILLKNKKYPVE